MKDKLEPNIYFEFNPCLWLNAPRVTFVRRLKNLFNQQRKSK